MWNKSNVWNLLKVNNKDTKMTSITLLLACFTLLFSAPIVDFKHISHFLFVFLLLILWTGKFLLEVCVWFLNIACI